jgi:hypothetical protein
VSSPVVVHIAGGTITTSIESIDGGDLMRIHVGQAVVFVLPVELAEDLVDSIVEQQADAAAAVQLI